MRYLISIFLSHVRHVYFFCDFMLYVCVKIYDSLTKLTFSENIYIIRIIFLDETIESTQTP